MKSIFIITAILAAAVTVGILQNSKLRDLKRRSASLEGRSPESSSDRPVSSSEFRPAAGQASQAERESLCEEMVAAFLAFKDRSRSGGPDPAARRRTMMLTAAKFGAEDIEHLLQQLRNDPRLAGLSHDQILEACLDIFAETTPAATMKFLEGHRDIPGWEGQYARCQRQFLIANPREAISGFEHQAAAGDPDVENSDIRQTVLLQEARIDPDKMLARALSPDFASDVDALSHLGGFVASTLHEPSEHQRFLAALRRAQAGEVRAPQLEKIRAEYVSGLSQSLVDFRFEDASSLVDSEFTSDEKLALASSASHRGDLSEPAKWANWFLKIDSEAWKEWNVRKRTNVKHPASDVLTNWAVSDYQAAGKWLAGVPAGPLKKDLSLEYAWRIAGIDPDHAATYLPELPESKPKRNLIKKIEENRKAKE